MELIVRSASIIPSVPWVPGLLGLFAFVAAPVVVRAGVAPPRQPRSLLWDVPRIAQVYTTVVGSLAGFASASLVFAARAGIDHPHPEFESMMALLLVAFITLAAAAMEFGNTPNSDDTSESFKRVQRTTFLMANVTLTQGICLSWLALLSVTRFAGLDVLTEAFAGLMVLVVLMAGVRIAQYLFDLTTACGALCLGTPLLAMFAAGTYLLVLEPVAPWLVPDEHAPLVFAMVAAFVGLSGFALQAVMFALHSNRGVSGRVARWVDYVAVGQAHSATTAICLVAIVVIRG